MSYSGKLLNQGWLLHQLSHVMPSAVHLQLSDFANFPALLPFESLANDTAEQFDHSVPGYMYNVTLRVEAIDKNKQEVSWSLQDIRRKKSKSTAWMQLQRRSNNTPEIGRAQYRERACMSE